MIFHLNRDRDSKAKGVKTKSIWLDSLHLEHTDVKKIFIKSDH